MEFQDAGRVGMIFWLTLAVATTAWAQTESEAGGGEGTWRLTGHITGGALYDGTPIGEEVIPPRLFADTFGLSGSDLSVETVDLFGAGVTLERGRFGFDLGVLEGSGRVERSGDHGRGMGASFASDFDLFGLRAAARYRFGGGRWTPWMGAGGRAWRVRPDGVEGRIGLERFELGRPEEETILTLTVGLGVDARPTERLSLRGEVEHGLDDGGTLVALSIGVRLAGRGAVERRRPALDLDVDTDRSGDVSDVLDDAGEAAFSPQGGAVVLANLDDDDGDGLPDAETAVIDGPADLADLAPLVLRAGPVSLPRWERLYLTMEADVAARRARIFIEDRSGPLEVLGPEAGVVRGGSKEWRIPSHVVRSGARLHVEALSYPWHDSVNPALDFDGHIRIRLVRRQVFGLFNTVEDEVLLRVAPWLAADALRGSEQVLIKDWETKNAGLRDSLRSFIAGQGLAGFDELPTGTPWVQDTQEIGYSSAPNASMHAALQSPNYLSTPVALDRDTAQFRVLSRAGFMTHDSMGNVEVTPPLRADGRDWILGRVYYGSGPTGGLSREIEEFLRAQEVQGPVPLDTTWLYVGHVDEVISFVPNPDPASGKPFKVLVADPVAGAVLLLFDGWIGGWERKVCEGEVDETIRDTFTRIWGPSITTWGPRIEALKGQIRQSFGLSDDDIVDVPVVLEDRGGAVAYLPNMVNLLVVDGHLVIPDPCLPVLRRSMENLLVGLGYNGPGAPTFRFVDTWTYTRLAGDIHCATNSRREIPSTPWWLFQ